MEPQVEPPPNASALIRGSAAVVAVAMFYVAILDWTVGQLYRPGSEDGLEAPLGNTQFYFAIAGAISSLVAAFFCFNYALNESRAGKTWISLMIAITASIAWRIFLTRHCTGC